MNPVIVLVRPQLGENIGKAARAMLNFGLTDLRLVAPRDGWPNPSAGPAAMVRPSESIATTNGTICVFVDKRITPPIATRAMAAQTSAINLQLRSRVIRFPYRSSHS